MTAFVSAMLIEKFTFCIFKPLFSTHKLRDIYYTKYYLGGGGVGGGGGGEKN